MSKLRKILAKTIFEPSVPIARLFHFRKFSEVKVKLVAVAKNEASYLSEWVLHHLYFGVDEIEIHYNQCDDNTVEVGQCLAKNYPIKLVNADSIFHSQVRSPQVHIYLAALRQAEKDGFSHVLFLDIDEFYTPKNLRSSIPHMLEEKTAYDVVAGNWCNKLNDVEEFGRAIEAKISIEISPTVKTITKTFVRPAKMNPHIVVSDRLRYGMTGKAVFRSDRDDLSKVTDYEETFRKADFFVLHRQYRSQREYIALLGRGRPIEAAKKTSMFKNNRRGYNIYTSKQDFSFCLEAYKKYSDYLDLELADRDLTEILEKARSFVEQRYKDVVSMIQTAPAEEISLLKRLLRNVDLPQDLNARWRR